MLRQEPFIPDEVLQIQTEESILTWNTESFSTTRTRWDWEIHRLTVDNSAVITKPSLNCRRSISLELSKNRVVSKSPQAINPFAVATTPRYESETRPKYFYTWPSAGQLGSNCFQLPHCYCLTRKQSGIERKRSIIYRAQGAILSICG